jgi:hypothetical protein
MRGILIKSSEEDDVVPNTGGVGAICGMGGNFM